MIRRVGLTVCLFAGCIWCMALATQADSAQVAAAKVAFKPVAPTESLMHGQGVFFKEIMGQLEKPAGVKRNKEIREAAEILAELSNVNRHHAEKDDYLAWATQTRDIAIELAAEAGKKSQADEKRIQAIVERLGTTCGACHDKYQED